MSEIVSLRAPTPERMRAERLIRRAVDEGWWVSLHPGDDLSVALHGPDQDVKGAIAVMAGHAALTLRLSRRVYSGNGKRVVEATFSLAFGGDGNGPVVGHCGNSFAERFYRLAYGLPLE